MEFFEAFEIFCSMPVRLKQYFKHYRLIRSNFDPTKVPWIGWIFKLKFIRLKGNQFTKNTTKLAQFISYAKNLKQMIYSLQILHTFSILINLTPLRYCRYIHNSLDIQLLASSLK